MLRHTQSGKAVANFTLAVSHRSKTNGEWQDVNDGFFRCTAWRSAAENAAHTLKKGMRQTVEIQVTHVGPDLQFATAEVTKSFAEVSAGRRRGRRVTLLTRCSSRHWPRGTSAASSAEEKAISSPFSGDRAGLGAASSKGLPDRLTFLAVKASGELMWN